MRPYKVQERVAAARTHPTRCSWCCRPHLWRCWSLRCLRPQGLPRLSLSPGRCSFRSMTARIHFDSPPESLREPNKAVLSALRHTCRSLFDTSFDPPDTRFGFPIDASPTEIWHTPACATSFERSPLSHLPERVFFLSFKQQS